MKLNRGQELITQQCLDFLKDKSRQVFEFTGGPGTGKSVVLNEIVRRSNTKIDDIACMAYTGQAAIVMRTKGLYNAKTILASQYKFVEVDKLDPIGNPILDPVYGTPLKEFKSEKVSLSDKKFIIIDEGYMTPNKLKVDLLSNGIKIIVAGDRNQLDPIGDKPAFLADPNIPTLTECMRQKEGSGIIEISQMVLQGIRPRNGQYGNDCLVIDRYDLDDAMLRHCDMLICGTNKTKDYFNEYFRRKIYGFENDLCNMGERVICRKNNWKLEIDGINLVNGMICKVVSHPDITTFDGYTFKMDVQPELFDNKSFDDIIVDFRYLKDTNSDNRKKYMRFTNANIFDYAYAITAHSSQGSQFRNVIYVEDNLPQHMNPNKINFVGASRASNKLIYVKSYKKRYF